MARALVIAAAIGALSACLPAHAQQDMPELDGGPPPLQVPKTQAPKPAPSQTTTTAAKLKAEEARLARQADAQKAEQARLERLADDLKAERTRLDARARDVAAEENRLAQLRTTQEAEHARRLADLERRQASISVAAGNPAEPSPAPAAAPATPRDRDTPARSPRVRISYDDARRACTRAGMAEALDLDFYSARYESAPHYYEDEREVRGLMRMDDRRGYLLVDTICELGPSGAVIDFALLR